MVENGRVDGNSAEINDNGYGNNVFNSGSPTGDIDFGSGSTDNTVSGNPLSTGSQSDSVVNDSNVTSTTGEPTATPFVPENVTRSDNDFYSMYNHKGAPKSWIDENGNLNPANVNGNASVTSHIRGGNSKNSPFISTTDPKMATPKDYGNEKITINTTGLQDAIDKGDVSGVKIIPHQEVLTNLENKVSQAQIRYNENPSDKNWERLDNANKDLKNATRDGEVLIQGVIPSEFIQLNN